MQWTAVTEGMIIVASEARAWLHRPALGGVLDPFDPFAMPMSGPGTLGSTQRLLDGALAAARAVAPLPPLPPLTPVRWAWRLASQYHTSHVGPALLAEARARFVALGRPELAEECARKVDEETGHDQLALRDLRALGYDAEHFVAAVVPPGARAVTDFFAAVVRSAEPVRVFGYTYAVERPALGVGREFVEAVDAVLPPGVRATRALRVHSALGSDKGHVADTVRLVASLAAHERALVARTVYETTRLMQASVEPSEEELARLVAGATAIDGQPGGSHVG